MPKLTRWYIRTALIYLFVGSATGFVMLVPVRGEFVALRAAIAPVQLHLWTVGWLTQLIFGVVWWMFPRHTKAAPYGNERLGWATYALLNAGLALRAFAEPLSATRPGPWITAALLASAALQWFAVLGFVSNTWSRVKTH